MQVSEALIRLLRLELQSRIDEAVKHFQSPEYQAQLEERLRPYRTKVCTKSLLRDLD